MKQKDQITYQQFKEIEELVESATLASTKESAKSYINQLRAKIGLFSPPAILIFGDLLGEVEAASGQVKNKEHWIDAAKLSLYKLNSFAAKGE